MTYEREGIVISHLALDSKVALASDLRVQLHPLVDGSHASLLVTLGFLVYMRPNMMDVTGRR